MAGKKPSKIKRFSSPGDQGTHGGGKSLVSLGGKKGGGGGSRKKRDRRGRFT